MDTHIQIGPTGKKLLPLSVKQPVGSAPHSHSHGH
jgi:hypothetical protein